MADFDLTPSAWELWLVRHVTIAALLCHFVKCETYVVGSIGYGSQLLQLEGMTDNAGDIFVIFRDSAQSDIFPRVDRGLLSVVGNY